MWNVAKETWPSLSDPWNFLESTFVWFRHWNMRWYCCIPSLTTFNYLVTASGYGVETAIYCGIGNPVKKQNVHLFLKKEMLKDYRTVLSSFAKFTCMHIGFHVESFKNKTNITETKLKVYESKQENNYNCLIANQIMSVGIFWWKWRNTRRVVFGWYWDIRNFFPFECAELQNKKITVSNKKFFWAQTASCFFTLVQLKPLKLLADIT